MMGNFIGDLVVKLIEDNQSGLWELQAPLAFYSAKLARTFTAPTGFRTDFCSVPRVPIAFPLLGDRARRAGTLHDLLYTTHEVDRETADGLLKEMLLQDGVDECEAQAFYLGVRLGGGSHWGPDPAPAAG
jgi:hypothetical protein